MRALVKLRLEGVKTVLFDLDGTLVDSSEAITNAVKTVLESRGLTCNRAEVARMIGLPLENIFSALAPNLSKEEIWQLVLEYRRRYATHHLENTGIHPSAQILLRQLKAKGFKLGIITCKYRKPVMDILAHFGVSELFNVVVSGYEVKRHKPAPDIVLEAAKRLRVDPKQCVVVGDSPVDVQAGKRAGSFTIAVLSNIYNRRQLKSAKPTVVIEELEAILKILL
jgi:2-phosphoglycolate phosphatase